MDGPDLASSVPAAIADARVLSEVAALSDQLAAERETVELLQESMAQLEDDFADRGWLRLSAAAQQEFSRSGLTNAAQLARILSVANPLIKRGLALRAAYVWGQGVSVAARAKGDEGGQDVNAVVQAFWDHPLNRKALTSSQAAEELEKTGLGCNGNVLLACFTSPLSGAVELARLPFDEVQDIICNPDNAAEHWFYLREWESDVLEPGYDGTRMRHVRQKAYYPALGYRPPVRPRTIGTVEVLWDAPVWHVAVNRLDGWKFGIGDAYAAMQWARAYKEFLEDWARLMKALSRFAWRLSSTASPKARLAGAKARMLASPEQTPADASKAGATAALGPEYTLEAIPKTGATLDSESGKPLAAMIAAALGVPVTMLLGDPGITGARAVAESLDTPTELEMGLRRTLWGDSLRQLLDYVVDQAVKAPRGPLKGTVARDDFGREAVVLTGDTERTLDIVWPDLTDASVTDKVAAVVSADGTSKMPPETTARLLLEALGVEDVDEILDGMTDDEGNWVGPHPAPTSAHDPFAAPGGAPVAVQREASARAGGLRRRPTMVEAAAKTDFRKVQAQWQTALDRLVGEWGPVKAAQVDQLTAQVEAAVRAGDIEALSAMSVDTGDAAALLESAMLDVADEAARAQSAEAAGQGVDVPPAAADTARIGLVAAAIATLMGAGLVASATRKALQAWTPGQAPTAVGAIVRNHLVSLTDAALRDNLGAGLSSGQNAGRMATLHAAPAAAMYVASEILDASSCEACLGIDGHEYANLAEAEADYASGGYIGCLGGLRCRGIIVTVWDDSSLSQAA